MGRAKREDTATQALPSGGVMEVKMTGRPEEIREHLGLEEQAPTNGDTQEQLQAAHDDEFTKSLADPSNAVIVKRISPREWEGQKTNVEVWREDSPLTFQDIHDEISQRHGGKKYRVAVVDRETGRVVQARRLEVEGDPILETPNVMSDDDRRLFETANVPEISPSQMGLDAIEQTARLTAAQIQAEQLKQQLDSLKGNSGARINPANDRKMQELEAKILETQYQSRLDAVESKHRAELEEVKRKLDAIALQPAKPAEDPMMKLMFEMMRQNQEQMRRSDERIQAMMERSETSKLDQALRELREIKNAPKNEGSALKDNIIAVKEIAGLLGMDLPGAKDDDDGPDERSWHERLFEDYVPKIFDLIEDRKDKGEPALTKEQIVAQFDAMADKAAADAVAKIKQAPKAPPPAPVQQIPAAPQGPQMIDKPPMVAAPEPVVPMPAPKLTPEQEIAARCNGIMETINREAVMRPRDSEWPYLVWGAAPEDILEKMAMAPDPVAMFGAFDGILLPEALALFKAKVAADPKVLAWLNRGHNELKLWWKKAQLDPDFDPADEDSDESEVEGT